MISAPIIATTLPDCQKPSDFAITVSGTVADHTMTLVIKGAPGTYDLAHQYQTKPTIDLTIDGISPGTWHATTGGGGSGKLTIQEEGRGSIDVTLSGPTGASAEGETVSANWQCS